MAKKSKGKFYKTYTIEKSLKHHVIEWCATAFSLTGAVLNSMLNIYGFYLFIFGNLLWMSFSWKHRHYGLLFLNFVFMILNVYGIYVWKSKLL